MEGPSHLFGQIRLRLVTAISHDPVSTEFENFVGPISTLAEKLAIKCQLNHTTEFKKLNGQKSKNMTR